jgi:hypothetical protein
MPDGIVASFEGCLELFEQVEIFGFDPEIGPLLAALGLEQAGLPDYLDVA